MGRAGFEPANSERTVLQTVCVDRLHIYPISQERKEAFDFFFSFSLRNLALYLEAQDRLQNLGLVVGAPHSSHNLSGFIDV